MSTKRMPSIDLKRVSVASPCSQSWDSMAGDQRIRHCSACKLNVYNVADLSKAEAEQLIERSLQGERVCVRLSRRRDGTLITRDCPVGLSRIQRARRRTAAFAGALLSLVMSLVSCRGRVFNDRVLQGDISYVGPDASTQAPQSTEGIASDSKDQEPEMGKIRVEAPPENTEAQ